MVPDIQPAVKTRARRIMQKRCRVRGPGEGPDERATGPGARR